MASQPVTRLYFLDNLRAVVVLLVVVLHAAITYMTPPVEWWYVVDPDQHMGFTILVLLVDVPLMPIMFFIAGYFAVPSLNRRGPRDFLREKGRRVGLPWILGVVFLAPIAAWLIPTSRGPAPDYLSFWTGDFWGTYFQQSVYWFLGVLLICFLVLVYAWAFPARALLQDRIPAPSNPSPGALAGFVALTGAGSALLVLTLGINSWTTLGWFLVIQPVRIAFYVGFFMLGVWAERRRWFTAAGYRPRLAVWGPLLLATGGVYLAQRLFFSQWDFWVRVVTSFEFAAFTLAALLAGVAAFQRFGNGSGRAWRVLAGNSFGVYYLHPIVLYPLALAIRPALMPSVAKFALITVVATLVSIAGSAFVLRRVPGLRRLF